MREEVQARCIVIFLSSVLTDLVSVTGRRCSPPVILNG